MVFAAFWAVLRPQNIIFEDQIGLKVNEYERE